MKLYNNDCLNQMKQMEDNSVDSIITDPPYGLSFMGKKWDYDVPSEEIWQEALRVLKPGGTALIFAGSRTQHRMAVRVEDAGFMLKDTIMWVYSTGFPKGADIGKQLDKKGIDAQLWDGWKSHALKPSYEPILVCMKPNEGSYANNAIVHGVAGLNIAGSRVGDDEISTHNAPKGTFAGGELGRGSDTSSYSQHTGRYPSNVILDGSDEVLDEFPDDKAKYFKQCIYIPKASKAEKNIGLERFGDKTSDVRDSVGAGIYASKGFNTPTKNFHPTVKPVSLMEYLCTLTKTPTGGVVLDPFMGSGSTGIGAIRAGRDFIGIEMDEEFFKICEARIDNEVSTK